MTRNELLLTALARIEDGAASTMALADLASLPERTARRGLRALSRQGLVWSPCRGRWQVTPAGREIATGLMQSSARSDHVAGASTSPSAVAILWRDGLAGVLRPRRGNKGTPVEE